MKKIIALLFGLLVFYSCLNTDDTPNFTYEYLPVDEAETPTSLIYGEIDTIVVKYSLPSSCYSFDRMYYEYQDSTRIVAITALVELDENCADVITQEEYKFPIKVSQQEDYIFKFFKGKDSDGENIFEEVVVPVVN